VSTLTVADIRQKYRESNRDAHMKITLTGATPKPRRLSTLAPMGTNVTFGCHNSDVYTAARALLERVYFVEGRDGFRLTPVPEPNHLWDQLTPLVIRLASMIGHCNPITRDEFVKCYRGRKAKIYQAAVDSLNTYGLLKRDSELSSFVKAEKINLTEKPNPAPRIIQPRHPKFNVELGRYLKPIEHKVYDAINTLFGQQVVCKGLNAEERGKLIAGKWAEFSDPVAISLDAKRFDQHVSEDALNVEHELYRRVYRRTRSLQLLLAQQLLNIGTVRCADGTIKYRIRGGRCSGDMNTAMGNVILMCLMVFSYMSRKGIKYAFVDDGDDCVIIVEREHVHLLDDLEAEFLRFGFQMKRDGQCDVLEELIFCQCHPVRVNGEYRMVRDPRSCLTKDLLHTCFLENEKEWKIRRAAIAQCGLALAGDVPIYGQYYTTLGAGCFLPKNYSPNSITGMDMLAMRMKNTFCEPTEDTRYSFYLAFGITPGQQVALENHYKELVLTYIPRNKQQEGFVTSPACHLT
jgi:hypothetical protein